MTTINDIDQINAEAMMTLSEIGFAAFKKFRDKAMADEKGAMLRIKLKSWLSDRANMEIDLSHRIKCAPMRKAMA
jgi:hypothetical protein